MSFLGGVDLGSPADRVKQSLTRELELRCKGLRAAARFSGYAYRGSADLLLRHGRFDPGRVLPDAYQQLRGPRNHCFLNALEAAEADPSLIYLEGVYTTGYGHPRAHAWCLAPDGGVVEVTMPTSGAELESALNELGLPYMAPEHWGYYGVVFHPEFVRAHGMALGLPMFDRSAADIASTQARGLDAHEQHDWPVLKVPYDPNRKELP